MVPRDHRLAASKCVCFDDLLREELLQLPAGTDVQQILDEQARLAGAKLKISYRVGSLDAAVAMTRAGHGLAIIPRSSWESLGPFQGLAIVPIEESWSHTQLLVSMRKSQPETSPGFRLFSELAD
ncbi:MAG: LysR family transcriptional regulator [Ramlibacter sp.]|nr:LysR family transcriptional regulator [Ramlibacter sp.]